MLTWDTTWRLIKSGRVNPVLIGLTIEELELAIEGLKKTRSRRGYLEPMEDEVLRSFMVKKFLLVKKLRDYFRVHDYTEYLSSVDESSIDEQLVHRAHDEEYHKYLADLERDGDLLSSEVPISVIQLLKDSDAKD